jgi:ABC-2 type transport system permease protein
VRWRPYRALTVAVLRSSLRNPLASFGLFGLLLIMLAGVKYLDSARFAGPSVKLADQSGTPVARQLAGELRRTPGLAVTLAGADDARRSVDAGTTDVAVIIPSGLGETGPDGRLRPAQVQLVFRAGSPGEQALALVGAAVDRADRRAQSAPQALTATARVENAGVGLIDAFLPGLLSFNIIQSGLILAAGVFAGYRATGVLRRVQVTGLAPANLVLAHATAALLLGTVQVALMLVAARLLFTVHLDLVAMLLVAMLGYLVFLAAGFAISGWVRDAKRTPVIANWVGMPMIFVGLVPSTLVPPAAATALAVLPVSLVTHGTRVLIDGGGPGDIRLDLLGLAGWAVVLLAAAARTFRWDA